ncbi:MAG TPA: DUF2490 domain-containing protein [Patescibacteria group bacterium]|nr:DUF2490 domain-containing protein [Patescibacteria group bacterium]
MNRIITLIYVALLCFLKSSIAEAQTRVRDDNTNAWLMYFGTARVADAWSIHTEAQVRRAELLETWQQLLLRTGINFHADETTALTLGYAYVDTYPYGDFPAREVFPEHRVYQQMLLKGSLGRAALQHRYRLEQRWIEVAGTGDWIFKNRFRYLLRANVPVIGATLEDGEPYVALYDEIFIGFGGGVNNIFDQNRAYVALGWKFSKDFSAEIGYMHQLLAQGNARIYEYNHTLQLGAIYNLDLR